MPDDVLAFCIEAARKHVGPIDSTRWQADGDAAVQAMKDALDARFGPQWHVVAGKAFGSKVSHEAKSFAFFYLGDKAVLIFRAG